MLFERFASLSFYYNEVNKKYYNVCPAFYKFKIQPFQRLFDQLDQAEADEDISSFCTDAAFDESDIRNRSVDTSLDRSNIDRQRSMTGGLTR